MWGPYPGPFRTSRKKRSGPAAQAKEEESARGPETALRRLSRQIGCESRPPGSIIGATLVKLSRLFLFPD